MLLKAAKKYRRPLAAMLFAFAIGIILCAPSKFPLSLALLIAGSITLLRAFSYVEFRRFGMVIRDADIKMQFRYEQIIGLKEVLIWHPAATHEWALDIFLKDKEWVRLRGKIFPKLQDNVIFWLENMR